MSIRLRITVWSGLVRVPYKIALNADYDRQSEILRESVVIILIMIKTCCFCLTSITDHIFNHSDRIHRNISTSDVL